MTSVRALDEKAQTFLLCSQLLQYPETAWLNDDVWRRQLAALTDGKVKQALVNFAQYLEENTPGYLAENYVQTFDFSAKTTLYLTYSEFGEQRERGKALVDLKTQFRAAGFELVSEELPDFLPLILEFAAAAPLAGAKLLARQRAAIIKLHKELAKMHSPYEPVLFAVKHNLG